MKKILFILLMSAISSATMFAQGKQYEVKVDGLSCPICTYGLEKKLKTIDGIENLKIELSTGTATFTVKEGKTVTEEQVKKKVKDAGYTFKSMKFIDSPKKD